MKQELIASAAVLRTQVINLNGRAFEVEVLAMIGSVTQKNYLVIISADI